MRLHPLNFRPGHEAPLDEYERLAATYGHTRLDIPDIRSESLTVDMADSDRLRLGALIKNCDVLVNVFSTTTLEAFLVDRPVVLVSSDVDTDRAAADGLRGFHDYEHVRAVIDQRAAQESLGRSRRSSSTSASTSPTRRSIATAADEWPVRELGPTDGSAGRRVGESLLEPARASPAGGAAGRASERTLRRVPRPRRRSPRPTFPTGASTGWVSHFSQER